MGNGAFDCGFGTASFVIKNLKDNNRLSTFVKLNEIVSEKQKIIEFNKKDNYYYIQTERFLNLPSYVFAYWASNNFIDVFRNKRLDNYYEMESRIVTGDNEKYLRYWYEISQINTCKSFLDREKLSDGLYKWFKCNKGGGYRKWYGNMDYVVNLQYNASEIKNNISPDIYRLRNMDNYSREAIAWPLIGDKMFSAKFLPNEVINNKAANALYINSSSAYNAMGYMNSKLFNEILNMVNPTVSYPIVNIASVPTIYNEDSKITILVKENIEISKNDWDSFETSWDFITHPLIEYKSGAGYGKDIDKWDYKIKDAYESWKFNCDEKFKLLKKNESELNRIFIDIYGLQDELTPDVEDKDITIRKADKEREIKSLISYAVGCMFGRYSLDQCGLVYAGGDFDKSKYKTFNVDEDNIIPITDEAYFGDDIVERFKKFIKVVYGDNTFNENMEFIAETLGKKGTETSEDTIRRYFLNDFFNDHVKIYQKRPIYWLFDSGKKNGFKALIYMHRFNENLIPKVRLDYLHRVQTTYEKLLSDVNYKLTTDLSLSDKKAAQNRQADLNAKLNEIKEYDEKIAHIANQRINIDLDDGVKVNYDKFKDILAKIK